MRFLTGGELEYLGRIDHQVKVRGFRIELEEIETVLRRYPHVQEAVVMARPAPSGDLRLVAYLVSDEPPDRSSGLVSAAAKPMPALRKYLKKQLPRYMVPAAFVSLAALPLTPNGKVDRKSLPEPAMDQLAAGDTAPRGATQELVAGIWSEVLGLERVGTTHSFFELGGHSLLATQVISRVRELFGVNLLLRTFFEKPTVAGLAESVEALSSGASSALPPLRPADPGAPPVASFAQQRMWFLQLLRPGSAAYNVPGTVDFAGDLDAEALERSLGEVVRRHEVLRTTFREEAGRPIPVVAEGSPRFMVRVDLRNLDGATREPCAREIVRRETRRCFDLGTGPLLRAVLLKLGERRHLLVVTLHHVISDGWSQAVLVRELSFAYEALRRGATPQLEELPIRYGDYACWQHGWLESEAYESQLAYWRERLAGIQSQVRLPNDFPRPPRPTFQGARLAVSFEAELTRSLEKLGLRHGATLFMTLLAGWAALLHRLSGQSGLAVGTPIANRTELRTERLIGLFVNTLVMRFNFADPPSFLGLLGQARDVTLGAYAHQDLPFERLVEELQPERDLSRNPFVQCFFVLQNAPFEPLALPGLDLTIEEIDNGTAKLDLSLVLTEGEGGLAGYLEYSTDLFEATTVRRLLHYYERLLTGVAAAPESLLKDLPLLSAAENRQLLDFNPGRFAAPESKEVAASFERLAALSRGDGAPERGEAMPGLLLSVLDRWGRLSPLGAPGQLHAGGVGLPRGDSARPGWTAARFVPDPFSQTPGLRLYRNGDMARYLPDGCLEYLGRIDAEVRLYFEPTEVETALLSHPGVSEAAVTAHRDGAGNRRLVAHLVADALAPTVSELRKFLGRSLPEHLHPALFQWSETLPRTVSGKIDRQALAARAPETVERKPSYVAPRNSTETMLSQVWSEVLDRDQVGIYDNFFHLGGHSLSSMQVMARIREAVGVELPLHRLFEAPTIAELASCLKQDVSTSAWQAPALVRVPRDPPPPLSFAQERLWFLHQLRPRSPAYNIPVLLPMDAALDVAVLERAVGEIIERHETLHTTFAVVGAEPVQVIAPPEGFQLPVSDLCSLAEPSRRGEALRIAQRKAVEPFDLTRGPLFRLCLVRLSEAESWLLVNMHHIVSDGWSSSIFLRELSSLYKAFQAGRPSPLAELPIRYADFAVWQRRYLRGEVLEQLLSFWKHRLEGAPSILELSTARPRPAVESYSGCTRAFRLSPTLSHSLNALSHRQGATLFMTLLAGFKALLFRYSGQRDLVVGTPVANRTLPETEGLIGFFVNSLVLRCDLSGNPSFVRLSQRVRETTLAAFEHQDLPIEVLVEELQPDRHGSHTSLFQVSFVLQNAPMPEASQEVLIPGLMTESTSLLELTTESAKFDLTLILTDSPTGLAGAVEYRLDLFDAPTIGRLIGHFRVLLEAAVSCPELCLGSLPLLQPAERQMLLAERTSTEQAYPQGVAIHRLVEEQVERTPEAVALIYEERAQSYGGLNREANRLARYLAARGVGPEVPVGILMRQGPGRVLSLLSILKAGGFFVPFDPNQPRERLKGMLEEARPRLLVTRGEVDEKLASLETRVDLDGVAPHLDLQSGENLDVEVAALSGAYVLYTSGSTGVPKGAMVLQEGLTNIITWNQRAYPPERLGPCVEQDRVQLRPFGVGDPVGVDLGRRPGGAASRRPPRLSLSGAVDAGAPGQRGGLRRLGSAGAAGAARDRDVHIDAMHDHRW